MRVRERASSAPRPSTLSSSLTLPSITEGREREALSTGRDGAREKGGGGEGTRSRHFNRSVSVGRNENRNSAENRGSTTSSFTDRQLPRIGGGGVGVGGGGGGAPNPKPRSIQHTRGVANVLLMCC